MHQSSIKEIADALKKKSMSSEEVTRHYINRIELHDPTINAVTHLCHEESIKQAKAIDAMRAQDANSLGELAGIPLLVKDNFCTTGMPTTCASKALAGFTSPYDATIISNCKKAGMVILGKCNMDEFAMGGSNENSAYGVVKNPWNNTRVPGGSSGGSAAAIAARLAPAATGSDTGGSIRQPAGFCGITGIKPSYGVISRYGMIAFASSLDQAGPMAASAEDCAILLSSMASHDPTNDMTSVKQPSYDYHKQLNKHIKGLKIGLPKQYFSDFGDKRYETCMQDAINELKALGASFIEIDLPDVKHCISAYYTIAPCEASSNLARFDGNIYGHRCEQSSTIETMYARSRSQGFGEEVKRRIVMGTYALSSGYDNDYYQKAQNIRNLIRHDFDEAWQHVDVVMAPTAPSTAFKLNQFQDDPTKMYQQDVYTIPVNLAELPALSMPIGFVDKLPVGLQLIGRKWDEATILNCAHQYQLRTDWHRATPENYR
jgi:aspartyl-tRNA(Asn)/glutamyl-tRNA(Gln) amidotransferase subunit A